MTDSIPVGSPLQLSHIPVEQFTPMSMVERAAYVRRLGLDDPSRSRQDLHNQFVEEQTRASLRRLKNSSALSNKIAYKRGAAHERQF